MARKAKKNGLPLSRPCTPQDLVDKARQYGPLCLETLDEVRRTGKGSEQVAACRELLDRGFGKVGQPIEMTGPGGTPVPLEVGVSPALAAALRGLRGVVES